MPFYEIDGLKPVVSKGTFVHPMATVIGDVIIGANCFIGPSAVLRGDFGRLILKDGCNIQDSCVLHGFPNTETIVEEDGHIGHGAILHGCIVRRNAMVGMNAVVMDGAVIGEDSIVAAMTFIKAGMDIPARKLVRGSPAKIVRDLKQNEVEWKSKGTQAYQELVTRYLTSMYEVEPLTEVEQNRKKIDSLDFMPLHNLKK